MMKLVISFVFTFSISVVLVAKNNRYLSSTLHSLDCLRSPTGLVADSAFVLPRSYGAPDRVINPSGLESTCPIVLVNQQTSPTNIALDLILLMEQKRWSDVEELMTTLEKMPFHASTGLFYNRYDIKNPNSVSDYYVSSVDNVHLVLALWVLGEIKVKKFSLSQRALQLSRRFNWEELIDPTTGLVRGGLSYDGTQFHPAPWFYSHAGSEARTLYSVGYAIGFVKKQVSEKALTWEFHHQRSFGEMMRTWDGGVFQMLLPELLIRESRYSRRLKSAFHNFSRFALAQSEGAPVPLLHSACQLGPLDFVSWQRNDCGVDQPCYLGRSGHKELISHANTDRLEPSDQEMRERASTLHAVFLAALFEPRAYLTALKKTEGISSEGYSLYHSQMGWMDSIHVSGPHKNKVVPMVLSLDQGMAALAMVRMSSQDGDNVVSRTLAANPMAAKRLRTIYAGWGL
ncbi:MAG: hypothetical protein RJB66_1793 [Pseudomonadota bacterium]|jgi:hypothetical protein